MLKTQHKIYRLQLVK